MERWKTDDDSLEAYRLATKAHKKEKGQRLVSNKVKARTNTKP